MNDDCKNCARLTADHGRALESARKLFVETRDLRIRAEAAERALVARDLCSCGHEPHLHDVEAVPSLCLICGHEDDCGLTAADAVSWRAKERALREFHREAIAEAAEEVAARDEVIAQWTAGLKTLAHDMHRGWKWVTGGADAAVLIDKFLDEHNPTPPTTDAEEARTDDRM